MDLTDLRNDLTQKTGFFINLTKSAKWSMGNPENDKQYPMAS